MIKVTQYCSDSQERQGINQGNDMADLARLSVTVYGRVQGVYFRYFVLNTARGLGLKGYVRNLSSGDAIEVKAEGEKPQLNKLLEQLKTGPSGAQVKRVDIDWADYSEQFTDFKIRY
jgi:acylphosphatase